MYIPRKNDVQQTGLDEKMGFGKYRLKTVREVCHENLNYLVWALRTVRWFEVSGEARTYAQIMLRERERMRSK